VLAPTATDSDALATGLFVMGAEQAEAVNMLDESSNLEAANQGDISSDMRYPMLIVQSGRRQDEVRMNKLGNFPLVDP